MLIEEEKTKRNLGDDVISKSKMGATVLATVYPPFQLYQKQFPHLPLSLPSSPL
jgi:hypothetical protein